MGPIFSTDIALAVWKNLPFFIPVLTGLIIYVIDTCWREDEDKDVLIYLAVAGLIGSVLLFWRLWMAGGPAYFINLPVSRFSLALLILVLVLAILFVLTAHDYYQMRGMNVARLVVYFLFATFGIVSALATVNVMVIFVGLVITSMALTFMLRSYGGDIGEIARKFWVYSLATDLIFCFGAVFLFGSIGTFDVGAGPGLISAVNEVYTGNYFRIGLAVMAVALFAKMAVVPLNWWVSDIVYLRSLPLIGIILFFYRAGVVLVALKLFAPLAAMWGEFFEVPIVIVAAVTMSWANLAAVRAYDMKSLLACSSIAHVGYILALFPTLMIADGSGAVSVVILVTAFSVAHLGALATLQTLSSDTADHTDFVSLIGLGRNHPWVALTLSLFLLALAGVPPLLGFISRFMAVRELALSGNYFILLIVAVNCALAVYYYTRPIAQMYLFKSEGVSELEADYPLIVVIALAAIMIIYLGILPASFIHWIGLSVAGM